MEIFLLCDIAAANIRGARLARLFYPTSFKLYAARRSGHELFITFNRLVGTA